jgi:hypothetical protein
MWRASLHGLQKFSVWVLKYTNIQLKKDIRMFRTHPPRLTYYTKLWVEGVEVAGQKALLNSHYRPLWVLLWVDSQKDLQVVEDQQGKQPDHMEVGVLDHTAVATGILRYVLFELSYAACNLLAGRVAVVHYNTPHPRREEETANIRRHIPEHNSCLLVMTPLPHSLT